MPTPMPAGLRLGQVEPTDAIAVFEQRGLLQPSFRWQDVWQEEHARSFAVAGVQRLDVLQIFRDGIDDAVRNGTSLAAYREALIPKLTAKGFWGDVEVTDPATGEKRVSRFDERRLKLIYDVNMRQSFAAGRWKRIQETKARMPFLIYWTMQDERVRASHRVWNALVLPVDHPFWDTHYPPNGWSCRCYAHAIDQKGIDKLKRAGVKILTEAPKIDWIPFVNGRTGEIAPVPRGIDPGFAYNPGKQRDEALHEAALRKALGAPPLAGSVAVAQATADHPAFVASATRRFAPFVDRVRKAAKPVGEVKLLGAMPPAAVRSMSVYGVQPATAVVAVRDADVLRMAGVGRGAAVGDALLRRLPELMARATALLLDTSETPAALVYVVELAEGGTVAVRVDMPAASAAATSAEALARAASLNLVRSAQRVDAAELRAAKYRLLWGALA